MIMEKCGVEDSAAKRGFADHAMFYVDHIEHVSSLALSGDELAVCADGVLHVSFPSQGVTRIIRGSDCLPISSRAVNVAWFGKDILFCEEHPGRALR